MGFRPTNVPMYHHPPVQCLILTISPPPPFEYGDLLSLVCPGPVHCWLRESRCFADEPGLVSLDDAFGAGDALDVSRDDNVQKTVLWEERGKRKNQC